jgi:predicted nucleic acid-binding protein
VTRHILDTGPIVAYLNSKDEHHDWAVEVFSRVSPPATTCEAVLSEACYLLRTLPGGSAAVLEFVSRGLVVSPFRLDDECDRVRDLITKYESVPMSFADACLVRMSEVDREARVVTVDRDFLIYRRNRRGAIPVLMPPD